jgi:DNA-binding MarR family transcriptional regulator
VAAHLIPVDPTAMEAVDPNSTHLLQLLNHVHDHVAKRVSVAVGGSGRLGEWAVLSVLSDGAGRPMRQIADITHNPSPTVTKLINRLVTCGLVYRRTDPLDRRRVLGFPTARGRSRYRRLRSLVDVSVASLADDEELRELVCELHQLIPPRLDPQRKKAGYTLVTVRRAIRVCADDPPRVRLGRHRLCSGPQRWLRPIQLDPRR